MLKKIVLVGVFALLGLAGGIAWTWFSADHFGIGGPLYGLLGGMSAAAGFLVPPGPPAARCPTCSHVIRRWPRARGMAVPVILGFICGIATVIALLGLVLALYAAHSVRSIGPVTHRRPPAGSLRPRLQACELFYKWEKTGDPDLLNLAVADAHSPRVPWQSQWLFNSDFGGLRSSIQGKPQSRSPATRKYERAVKSICKPTMADYHVRP